MPSSRFDVANPMIEGSIGPQRRIDFDRPVVEATIGGRPVFLVRPDERRASADEPYDLTVPITTSRMRRAIDIEYDRDAAQYVPSQLLGVGQQITEVPLTDEEKRDLEKEQLWFDFKLALMCAVPAAAAGALVAYGTRSSPYFGAGIGAMGALWSFAFLKGMST